MQSSAQPHTNHNPTHSPCPTLCSQHARTFSAQVAIPAAIDALRNLYRAWMHALRAAKEKRCGASREREREREARLNRLTCPRAHEREGE